MPNDFPPGMPPNRSRHQLLMSNVITSGSNSNQGESSAVTFTSGADGSLATPSVATPSSTGFQQPQQSNPALGSLTQMDAMTMAMALSIFMPPAAASGGTSAQQMPMGAPSELDI